MMYPEWPFLDRFEAAARDGFEAVEFFFPYAYDANELRARLRRRGRARAANGHVEENVQRLRSCNDVAGFHCSGRADRLRERLVAEIPCMSTPNPANETYRLPARLFDARRKSCWFVFGLICLTIASFLRLDLQFAKFFSAASFAKMGKFIAELFSPNTEWPFAKKLLVASFETLTMSALGTIIAAAFGILLDSVVTRFHSRARCIESALRRGMKPGSWRSAWRSLASA
jgi:hypothetical protein